MKKKPDILFIVLDTQRADRLSCYGYALETTPHLDEFTQEAALFHQAVAPAQWTVPTHASMFTGLYPTQHTTHQMDSILPQTIKTLAERLKETGYFTAGHSHNPLVGAVLNGLQRGFHTFSNYHTPAAGLLAFQFDQSKETASIFERGKHYGRFFLAESLGYSQQTIFQHLSPIGQPIWEFFLNARKKSKQALTRQSLEAVAKTLIDRPGLTPEQPIFAFVNLMGTHVPYAPPKWAFSRFLPAQLGQNHAQQLLQQANKWQVDVRNWFETPMEYDEYQAALNAFYDAEVAAQDAQLGWLLSQLKEANAFEETFIILVADHGDHLGEKQRLNHAYGVYEQLANVPLLIHDPSAALPADATVSQPVSTRRLFHTILSAAGAATVEEEMLSLANWADENQNEVVICEGFSLNWALQRLQKYQPDTLASYQKTIRAMYDETYKIIAQDSQNELYNLELDQIEANNLSIRMSKQTADMRNRLEKFISSLTPSAIQEGQQDIGDEKILAQLRRLGYME